MRRSQANPMQSLAVRRLEPEWLDEMPADDPRAQRSRLDLARINGWMFQARIMRRLLTAHSAGRVPASILDIGGGDGRFAAELAEGLACEWPDVEVVLVDKRNAVDALTRERFTERGWRLELVQGDILELLERGALEPADVAVANLVLHHFDAAALERLFSRLAPLAPLFVACEPRRSALALRASRLLWAIGCNDVSRHDAAASVRAGFEGLELSRLWPEHERWQVEEGSVGPFTHAFAAVRRPPT
ncbi:MAG TPA: class I SAM-dependent methyltransferase [Gammaproteobacteria bacterium]|nr:class I SAM-dependent methyltransferase [Gammaproteobacteria bacterium]